MSLPQCIRTNDDVPVNKWLRLFKAKASNAASSDRYRINYIIEHQKGETLLWYLTDIFDIEDS
ncbi:hypothetical protein HPB52_016879 [Rhipicephalus sanguineus]|uniref:Uncharacterized protein n=1 Tax=Rhipicephalus sanguineus TaxID=34632 RepID=A0A9D4QAN6_RHISA|nr:hypothetical protein HPB52_016879 [Rhipicephalus sanguineus]